MPWQPPKHADQALHSGILSIHTPISTHTANTARTGQFPTFNTSSITKEEPWISPKLFTTQENPQDSLLGSQSLILMPKHSNPSSKPHVLNTYA